MSPGSGLRNRQRKELFPTLLVSFDVDLPASVGIRDQILAMERNLPNVSRGERTAWQSDDRLFARLADGDTLGAIFSQAISDAFPEVRADELMLAAWANVLRNGDYFTPHTHGESAWSGTYYLDAGASGANTGGILQLRDPRAGAGMVTTGLNQFDSACTFEIPPHTGLLVIFPSWLTHWVTPYRGESPRISIAFNAR